MWGNSKPSEYLSFRVFIFGITNQSMFPNGVVYEGCEDNKPLYFRGESGANDSIVSNRILPKEKGAIPTNQTPDPPPRPPLRNPHAGNTPHQNSPRIPRLSPPPTPRILNLHPRKVRRNRRPEIRYPRLGDRSPLPAHAEPHPQFPLATLAVRA